MSFVKIDSNNFEYTGLKLRPNVTFVSSSIGGTAVGSNFVSPTRSKCLKQTIPSNFDLNNDGTVTIGEALESIFTSPAFTQNMMQSQTMSFSLASNHMTTVNTAGQIEKNTKTIDMFRFDLPVFFNANRTVKNVVRNILMPAHQHRYDNCAFTYSNYHTLNFFTSETIPTGSALIYPSTEDLNGNHVYSLPDAFSVNFWINPRYTDTNYRAGTILHVSSSIAISLVSGSSRDAFNQPDNFKILLQLSQSADSPPSTINLTAPNSSYPNDLIFTSSHNLNKNHWHHVCVQWSNATNNSTGSIFIDDNETNFYVPSASVSANSNIEPSGLVLGNYYDGEVNNLGFLLKNETVGAGLAANQGFKPAFVGSNTSVVDENTFSHPLNAEIHEVKIYNKVLASPETLLETERQAARNRGPTNFNDLVFYVPPFFYPTTPTREVHETPFKTVTSTTDDPFNVAFSFGINGKLINLENFTREFVQGNNPRLYGLFPITMDGTVENILADEYIYNTGSHKKRNMTILPNDNGLFEPNYFALASSEMSASVKFYQNPLQTKGLADYSIISLENLIPSGGLRKYLAATSGSMYDAIIASSSFKSPGIGKSTRLNIAERTGDGSSNEIVIYDISNLYYGNRIHPGTFELFEKDLTGSDGKIQIKLKDNERGSLYRADSLTTHAKWNNVGTVLYDEGMAVVKSPHLFFFNKNETNVTFRGEQNLHTMILNVPAFKEMFTSSSNPSFISIPPSEGANDEELSTLYVTTVNIHDDNFNIIMKANFAQPIFKTEEDEFIIRLKEDF